MPACYLSGYKFFLSSLIKGTLTWDFLPLVLFINSTHLAALFYSKLFSNVNMNLLRYQNLQLILSSLWYRSFYQLKVHKKYFNVCLVSCELQFMSWSFYVKLSATWIFPMNKELLFAYDEEASFCAWQYAMHRSSLGSAYNLLRHPQSHEGCCLGGSFTGGLCSDFTLICVAI